MAIVKEPKKKKPNSKGKVEIKQERSQAAAQIAQPAPEKDISGLVTFIKHPALVFAFGILFGLIGTTYPLPVLSACGLLLVWSFHASRVVPGTSSVKQFLWSGVFLAVVFCGLYAILLEATPWTLQHSKPLEIGASISSIKHAPGTRVAGIEWKADYQEVRADITNISHRFSVDQIDLLLGLEGSEIAAIGQRGGVASCRFIPSGDLGPVVIDPNAAFVQRTDGSVIPVKVATSRYTVYCDHLAPTSDSASLVLAVTGESKPHDITITGGYDVVDGDKRIRMRMEKTQAITAYK